MTHFDAPMDRLREQIDALASLPPDQTVQAWRKLGEQVNALCQHLEKSDPATAHATLPALGDLIRQMDRVVEDIEAQREIKGSQT